MSYCNIFSFGAFISNRMFFDIIIAAPLPDFLDYLLMSFFVT